MEPGQTGVTLGRGGIFFIVTRPKEVTDTGFGVYVWSLSCSLGLIADSFHMFFDCTALLAGLVATVITRWSPNERFSYG